MAMTLIPNFFVLTTANIRGLYLRPNTENGLLEFGETNVFSPRVKFAVEQSKTGDATLVHIRSCFNNKYWVAHKEAGKMFFMIAASAKKPKEDTTDPACTLFRVSCHSISRGFHLIRLICISRSMYALRNDLGGDFILYGDPKIMSTEISGNIVHVLDWERLVILPSQVSFKSEHLGGNYLRARVVDGYNHNSFESGLDIGDPNVGYELIPASNGNYRIKSLQYGKLLTKINPEWIAAHGEDNNDSDDTLFSFIKIKDNVFGLSCLANEKFCGGAGAHNCLSASYTQLSKETRLIVEERVVQKKISNVKYRLGDSIIHDEEVEEVVNEFATNNGNKEAKATLQFSKTDSTTTTWNNSLSLTTGASYSFGFEVGKAPFVFKNQVEITSELGTSREWGQSNTEVKTSTATYDITVPPLTTIRISLMVTKGACDVPFSYRESVLLPDGKWVITEKDDGIYKGIRSLDFYYDYEEVDYQPHLGKMIGNK